MWHQSQLRDNGDCRYIFHRMRIAHILLNDMYSRHLQSIDHIFGCAACDLGVGHDLRQAGLRTAGTDADSAGGVYVIDSIGKGNVDGTGYRCIACLGCSDGGIDGRKLPGFLFFGCHPGGYRGGGRMTK